MQVPFTLCQLEYCRVIKINCTALQKKKKRKKTSINTFDSKLISRIIISILDLLSYSQCTYSSISLCHILN